MESYHHRPLWDRSFKSPKKKKTKKKNCLCMLVREKLKKLSNFFSWSCLGESFRTSPNTWGNFSEGRKGETPQKVAPGKPIWWRSINIYTVYIYTPKAFKITLNHVDFKIPHLSLLLKILEMVELTFMRHTRQGASSWSLLSDRHGSIFCDKPQVLQQHEVHNRWDCLGCEWLINLQDESWKKDHDDI